MKYLGLIGFVFLAACNQPAEEMETINAEIAVDPVEACTKRGVEYFTKIGSYPTLNTAPNIGRAAVDVALERCQRTTTAF